jgi:NAD(P)-dependent dehydrogenase (short-subunit alcohol dehydrogenase family)
MKIKDARAVITGGASGLGNAVAQHVVANGGKVVLLDVQEAPGQAAAKALGASASFVKCDVSSESEVNAAMAAAKERMGAINPWSTARASSARVACSARPAPCRARPSAR